MANVLSYDWVAFDYGTYGLVAFDYGICEPFRFGKAEKAFKLRRLTREAMFSECFVNPVETNRCSIPKNVRLAYERVLRNVNGFGNE